jgi:uncharacterized membrane-anchored protein
LVEKGSVTVILVVVAGSVLLWIPFLSGTVEVVWPTILATVGFWVMGAVLAALRHRK